MDRMHQISQTMVIPTKIKECWGSSGLQVGTMMLIVSPPTLIKVAFDLIVIRCEVLAARASKWQMGGATSF